ncbi:MAG: helix-turn-helix domain-containing protein [Phycisphaerales bacterium]|jgi:excisionase family DNA binding protein
MALTAETIPATTPWLDQSEAAEYLGCSPRTIRNYIASGRLPAYRVKGSKLLRVRRTDVDALLVRIPTASAGGE